MSEAETILLVKDLYYKPLAAAECILNGVSLELKTGDFVLLLGPSGCGKSMLIRCLNGLIPHLEEGEFQGSVVVKGKNTRENPIHEFSPTIGMVFQNPDDQILSLKVVDEVAWGVENQGLPREEIVRRVEEFLDLLEIRPLKDRLTFAISGGQKQRVSIAANLAMLQDILVLDDPTTDLDPVCKTEVVQTLAHLNQTLGKTLIVIEHDLNDLIELANRIVVMDDSGRVRFDGEPGAILAQHYEEVMSLGVNMPQHVEIAHACLEHGPSLDRYPMLKEEAFAILQAFVEKLPGLPAWSAPPKRPKGKAIVQVTDLEFAYEPGKPILRGLSFEIYQEEFVAIIGANGSGKSTLVNNLIGLLRPGAGQVVVDGHDTRKTKVSDLAKNIGYVFQNPDHQLFANTVASEVGFSFAAQGITGDEAERRTNETLEIVGLARLRDRHPFSLSRGQRQKLAVATALAHKPRIVLLDEPTTGQDRRALSGILNLMVELGRQGNTTIMVTHDMDIVAAYATRVIVMAEGKIVLDGPPEKVFYENYEELRGLNLKPPTVIEFCRRLQAHGLPRFLVTDDLLQYLERAPVAMT